MILQAFKVKPPETLTPCQLFISGGKVSDSRGLFGGSRVVGSTNGLNYNNGSKNRGSLM